jgi:hypothetical protein
MSLNEEGLFNSHANPIFILSQERLGRGKRVSSDQGRAEVSLGPVRQDGNDPVVAVIHM